MLKKWHLLTYTLVIIGALNWGFVGLFDMNLVETLFAEWPHLITWVYVLVGLAGLVEVLHHSKHCKTCADMMKK